jgi:hypothetical protein
MKKFLVLVSALVVLQFSSVAEASSRAFGAGIVLGEPSGFSAKTWLRSNRAIDMGLAFSLNDFFLLFADYDYHFGAVFGHSSPFVSRLNPYIGIGAALWFSTHNGRTDRALFTDNGNSVGFGLRIPFGIEWLPNDPPIGVFVELAAGIGVIPSTFGFFQGGIGVRYYF